jgi:transposase
MQMSACNHLRREDFSGLFKVHGRPAIAPWRLALVTVKQFSEGLLDRQAAEAALK